MLTRDLTGFPGPWPECGSECARSGIVVAKATPSTVLASFGQSMVTASPAPLALRTNAGGSRRAAFDMEIWAVGTFSASPANEGRTYYAAGVWGRTSAMTKVRSVQLRGALTLGLTSAQTYCKAGSRGSIQPEEMFRFVGWSCLSCVVVKENSKSRVFKAWREFEPMVAASPNLHKRASVTTRRRWNFPLRRFICCLMRPATNFVLVNKTQRS